MATRTNKRTGEVQESQPDGSWKTIKPGMSLPSLSIQTRPADPMIPGRVQGQGLNNRGQELNNVRTEQQIDSNSLNNANTRTNIAQGQNSLRQSQIGNVADLRKEFTGLDEVVNYNAYLGQLSKVLHAPDNAQGDLSIIYAFAKAQDPSSAVRGEETDMAKATASIIDRLKQKYKSFAEGNRLPPEVRQGLIETIRSAGHGFQDAYDQRRQQYTDNARAISGDPERVVGPYPGKPFQELEREYVAKAKGQDAVPGISYDPKGNVILQDHGRGTVKGSDTGLIGEKGGFHTEQMPGMAGADAAVNTMLKAHRPLNEITAYLKSRGMQDQDIAGVIPQYLAIQQFQQKNHGYHGDFNVDLERRQAPNSVAQNLINSDVGTGTALGLNALAGGIPSALAGNQQNVALARDAHPKSALAGEVAGAIGGTVGLNKALGAIPRFMPAVGATEQEVAKLASRRLLGADLGYGATFGATQNPDDPVRGALLGAGASLGGNLVGRYAIAPGARLGGNLMGLGPKSLPVSEGMVAGQAMKANPDEVIGKLRQAESLGMPYSLADADPRLRALTGSAVRKSPDAYAMAAETVGPRNMGQADRAIDLIKNNLAQPVDLPTFKTGAKTSAQKASRDLYAAAEAHPAPDDAALNDMLHTPAGEQAARSAYARALNNGEKVGDLSFEIDSLTGEPRITGKPNWKTLHYIKMEMDKMPEAGTLGKRFVGRLGTLNKDYRAANATYAKEIRLGDIAQDGYDAFNSRVSTPQLAGAMQLPRNAQNLGTYKSGFASAMTDAADKARLSADPYNIIFGSPRQQSKMGTLFPDGSQRFATARGLENDMSLTNRELLGGSPTQPRAESDKLFDAGGLISDGLELGLGVASGTPPINLMKSKLFAGRGLFGGLRDAYQMGVGTTGRHRAEQLAPMLLNQNPGQAADTLADLVKRQAEWNAYAQRTRMLGSGIGAPLGIAGLTNR